jgi:chromosome segregation protein
VYLKSLTLKGFKSFASATTLNFEPGITAVVGPNGSGKSNVVDALAWVMGEQGAKSLRGGKMEDVIFAGTSDRAPLGRAEVTLTIDNSDGSLPIEYAEVTVTRTMFRNGGSEYAINGNHCRLLDVQELLSDSGIGREMHVIVGQGQLDSVLSATPEERRGFIEEAAGVLKHRKRKEKALRKIESMDANLVRLQDLTGELRRQLKPLGRQAEVARRAVVIQADVRDARLRLLAEDLLALRSALDQEVADETALRERRAEVEAELAGLQSREAELEVELAGAAPTAERANDSWYRLSSLRERFLGTASLAGERLRLLGPEADAEPTGRDPENLAAEARAARSEDFALGREVEATRGVLAEAVRARTEAENGLAAEERRLTGELRAAADRREGLARLVGQVSAARSRLDARAAEVDRLAAQTADARARADTATVEFHALEAQVAGLDEGEVGLDEEHESAAAALAAADNLVADLRLQDQETERRRAGYAARVEALASGLAPKDGTAALMAAGDLLADLLGPVASLVAIRAGYEVAVATALGPAAEAIVVGGSAAAVAALEHLRATEGGRATLLVGSGRSADFHGPELPAGCEYAVDVVTAAEPLRSALTQVLRGVVVVVDLNSARELVDRWPNLIAVTRRGDLLGAGVARGGMSDAPSAIEVQASLDEARTLLRDAEHRSERLRFELSAALDAQELTANAVAATLARLHESDARLAAVAEKLGHLGQAARAANAEADRLAASMAAASSARDDDERGHSELSERLAAAEVSPDAMEPDRESRDKLSLSLEIARTAEVEVRLSVRSGEERQRALAGRADQLERAALSERSARLRAAERKERRARELVVAVAVVRACELALVRLADSITVAGEARAWADEQRRQRETELATTRARLRELATELERLTDVVHRDEVARTEQRMRVQSLEDRSLEEFGVDAEALLAEYGPEVLVTPSAAAPGDEFDPDAPEPMPYPYVRVEQERRLRTAEKALNLLGRVNPLALEEFTAMEERHAFLTAQLDDLKKSRRDLLDIVREVDERVMQVFSAAFADTEREFETIFARLFPGGEGRLILTDPNDPLTTGIDVEARPPGKKVRRLSLLSGGERSLTAVAFLIALFKARPSPFYVLDEVEAALDDTNLGRLIEILAELRSESQLLIVTHQKRTMEIADALYGVSMRNDGVTQVISQRLREVETV